MSGPMPTHFRWVWYLVGLAGMALMVLGIIAIIGSAIDTGILIPLVIVVVVVVAYALVRFRRSLDAALANAPSRQPGASPAPGPSEPGSSATLPTDADDGPADDGPDVDGPADAQAATSAPAKSKANPGRTSRR